MKVTSKTQAPESNTQPKSIAVREIVPWLIVTAMAFAVAGVITGWMLSSSIVADRDHAVTVALKEQSR